MKHLIIKISVVIFCVSLLFMSCTKKDDVVNPLQSSDVTADLNSGKANLENGNVLNAFNDYKSAFQKNPNNTTANLGYGLLQLMTLVEDQEIQNLLVSLGFQNFPTSVDNLFDSNLMDTFFSWILSDYDKALPNSSLAVNEYITPLYTALINKLNMSTTCLNRTLSDANFTFLISVDGTTFEIDSAEIYFINAIASFMKAAVLQASAIDMDCEYSHFLNGEYYNPLIDQNYPNFLTIDAQKYYESKTAYIAGTDAIINGCNFLLNESDNQDDDLIPLDVNSIEELTKIKDTAQLIKQSLEGSYIDILYDGTSITSEIAINLGNFFDTAAPIKDLYVKYDTGISSYNSNYNQPIFYSDSSGTVEVDPYSYSGPMYLLINDATLGGLINSSDYKNLIGEEAYFTVMGPLDSLIYDDLWKRLETKLFYYAEETYEILEFGIFEGLYYMYESTY